VNELALFAGAGGGILGGRLLGWRTVCAVERNPDAARILLERQNDGSLEPFPVWDDVCTFDGRPWRGLVDVVSGGFPCQDISNSGHKVGIEGERSGLWREMARIVGEVRPGYVFVENVAALLGRGLGAVLADLAGLGFHARWGVLGTADVAGAQPRERVWIVAHAEGFGRRSVLEEFRVLQAASARGSGSACPGGVEYAADTDGVLRPTEPGLVRVADGVADRVDRIRLAGNGQDPRVAAEAWTRLTSEEA
jgi:DNA (cytosine-5)-methyltransferase 1